MFTLTDLLSATGGQLVGGDRQATFQAISIDSRTTHPGDLFVAFKGEVQDGHEYVTHALSQGAAGALVDHAPSDAPWLSRTEAGPAVVRVPNTGLALENLARSWRRSHAATVVAVTGSVGKTSTKEIISSLLGQRWPVLRSQANYNTEIGLPMTLMQLDDSHRVAVLEMGMHDVGEIRRLARIAEPNIGVVTNVHLIHLERLGTLARIREAKSELVQELPASGLALLNADDANVRSMAGLCAGGVLTFGLAADSDVRALDVESQGLEGTRFTVNAGGERRRTLLPMPGQHFVPAALAAVAVATRLGMDFSDAVDGLERVWPTVSGRLHPLPGVQGSTLLDDAYNASPASVVAALDVLAEMPGRRIAVLGDMFELGAFEEEGHRIVGQRAATAADWLVALGPRARTIAREAAARGLATSAITQLDDLDEAITLLRSRLIAGDAVLVKASHGMGFARIVDALRADGEPESNLGIAS
jgi:UDP-N-acetylmuramoyl-tripeptide--D-alanyl-D-alanine ligase